MNRREFIQAGAGLILAAGAGAAAQKDESDALNVALIGAGEQGRALLQSALDIPKLRWRAICDIWPYRRKAAVSFLRFYKQEPAEYSDYREMLAKERDLDAVVIATPDFAHSEQACACLNAGRHVYCEKPMAHSAESARAMVRAMQKAGKLLQIGYQRRSNPRYQHVREKLLCEAKLIGRICHVNAQSCSPVQEDLGWPQRAVMADDELRRFGYSSMHEFRNWRYFRKFCAGLFADRGVHQIDVSNWFLGARPKAVMASGGLDYYKDRQWPDNLMAVVEYDTADGAVRAFYQVLSTTSAGGGSFEHFMGVQGSIRMSESPKLTKIYREPYAPEWDRWIALRYLAREDAPAGEGATSRPADPNEVRVKETGQLVRHDVPIVQEKPACQYHLENFFDAIRAKAKLNCPGDEALATEAAIWKVNEAAEARRTLSFAAEDFRA